MWIAVRFVVVCVPTKCVVGNSSISSRNKKSSKRDMLVQEFVFPTPFRFNPSILPQVPFGVPTADLIGMVLFKKNL